ncbi:MAG: hypothetical protein JSV05_01935 [Candidatus Bathyarchaeota archaeon]|nr:MAG: hypothetical protein JSV05_01935 [Candidatus Bathyarchaeota archaeon]
MLIRIVHSLTPEEVLERIRGFENQFNSDFEEFEDLFLRKRRPGNLLGIYLDWARLVDAYRGYEESGELDYIFEEVKEFGLEQLAKLTPKRLALLYQLAGVRVGSISELAHRVKRDVKNVYDDLLVLSRLGLVVLRRRGLRNIVPETLVEEITFLIR